MKGSHHVIDRLQERIAEHGLNDEVELTLFKEFDVIICHNEKMKQFLLDNGFQEHQIVCLEIFDYLSDAVCRQREKTIRPCVAIAGTLLIS